MAFRELMRDEVVLIKRDGRRFAPVAAAVSSTVIHTDAAELPIEEGDRFERKLPNGLLESYLVLDRGFYSGLGGIPDHYQTKVRKETATSNRRLGPTIYNITGPNARVNINSLDLSANVVEVGSADLFDKLEAVIRAGVEDEVRRAGLLSQVEELKNAEGKGAFLEKYRQFIASAADHMALLAPFIPALTQLLQ